MNKPITIKHRKDYKPSNFLVDNIGIYFNVVNDYIEVTSNISFSRNPEVKNKVELELNGEDLETLEVEVDGIKLHEEEGYIIKDDKLVILAPKDKFVLNTKVKIYPEKNTKLMGIYKSGDSIVSQCESEGFRRITWFLDRPDIMTTWNVMIEADSKAYGVLLSNGNLINKEEKNGRTIVTFLDKFKKPCYLFAFVAGNFDSISDKFITKSNREVNLNIYVEKGKQNQAHCALESLKRAMKWDEDTFNLEYDLDVFSIVAVNDFNFGAMENKSLNIFNDVYVLADPEIATDSDYFGIESVVAHEYFHNWTGDRVTCRDWFQLTLKEGLTVFRDHIFSQDFHYKDAVRINHVGVIRSRQFVEDEGPLAHPIRPDSYIEMNNFYTTTVYEKGSEVIHMLYTMLGKETFKKGIKIYFDTFDGKAVTCDDFIWAMEEAYGYSLENFKKWYSQSGTPLVNIQTKFNSGNFEINLEQVNTPTAKEPNKADLVIPIKVAIFNKFGEKEDIHINNKKYSEYIVLLEGKNRKVVFSNLDAEPSLSVNRDFSAPILVKYKQSDEDLINLIKNDDDGFARYDASRNYFTKHILKLIDDDLNGRDLYLDHTFYEPFRSILETSNDYINNFLVSVPSYEDVSNKFNFNIPVNSIYKVIKFVKQSMAHEFESTLLNKFRSIEDKPNDVSKEAYSQRATKNMALSFLMTIEGEKYFTLAKEHYYSTKNMTNRLAVLVTLKDHIDNQLRNEIYRDFYDTYKGYPNVINKLLSLEALALDYKTLDRVKTIMQDENTFSYKNPNKVRALIGNFVMNNNYVFHRKDGEGYKFFADFLIKLDDINAFTAAGLAKAFSKWKKFESNSSNLMRLEMQRVLKKPNISSGLFEILDKMLND